MESPKPYEVNHMKNCVTAESMLNDIAKTLTSENQETTQDIQKPQAVYTPIVEILDGSLFTTSLNVAEVFGKSHKDVLRKIEVAKRNLSKSFSERNFAPAEYMDAQNKPRPMYRLTRDGFASLVMGFTGKKAAQFREAYIAVFNAMEAELKKLILGPSDQQKYFDRVDMNKSTVDDGYFGIFHEIAVMIPELIAVGVRIDEHTMPDISVGNMWGAYWTDNNLEEKYGKRIPYHHVYPPYFPQAKKKFVDAWQYPDKALPEFRYWFKHIYLPENFPNYMRRKVRQKDIPASVAAKAIAAFQPKAIEESRSA